MNLLEEGWARLVCLVRGHDWRVVGDEKRGGLRLCRRCPEVEALPRG